MILLDWCCFGNLDFLAFVWNLGETKTLVPVKGEAVHCKKECLNDTSHTMMQRERERSLIKLKDATCVNQLAPQTQACLGKGLRG